MGSTARESTPLALSLTQLLITRSAAIEKIRANKKQRKRSKIKKEETNFATPWDFLTVSFFHNKNKAHNIIIVSTEMVLHDFWTPAWRKLTSLWFFVGLLMRTAWNGEEGKMWEKEHKTFTKIKTQIERKNSIYLHLLSTGFRCTFTALFTLGKLFSFASSCFSSAHFLGCLIFFAHSIFLGHWAIFFCRTPNTHTLTLVCERHSHVHTCRCL